MLVQRFPDAIFGMNMAATNCVFSLLFVVIVTYVKNVGVDYCSWLQDAQWSLRHDENERVQVKPTVRLGS